MTQRRNRRSGVEDRWRDLAKERQERDKNGKPLFDENGEPIMTLKPVSFGKGKRWRARYVDDAGQEHAKGFEKKIDAQAWLDAQTAAIVSGTHVAPSAGLVTVAEMHAQYVGTLGNVKQTTRTTREYTWTKHVKDRWSETRICDIKKSDVLAWVNDMREAGTKAATIENAVGLLRMILELAKDDKRIAVNPCHKVKLPPREPSPRAYLTHNQVDLLASTIDQRYRLVVLFLCYTGLRYGEMAALKVSDFDMLRRRATVRQSVTEVKGKLVWSAPKNHERRTVPFPKFLVEDLVDQMKGKKRGDLVFTAPEGGVLRIATFRTRAYQKAIKSLRPTDEDGNVTTDFPRATIHDLRHSAASLAISAGANVKAVQTMLGHASAVLTLDTYADLFPDDLERVADALDAARSAAADDLRTNSAQTA